uniref:PLAT domain-containing protein n=1 Tax=Macrostomum lignano TaxID=282301 RepID=A0A1I8FAY0_9PLAT
PCSSQRGTTYCASKRGSQLYFRCTQSVPAGEELRFALKPLDGPAGGVASAGVEWLVDALPGQRLGGRHRAQRLLAMARSRLSEVLSESSWLGLAACSGEMPSPRVSTATLDQLKVRLCQRRPAAVQDAAPPPPQIRSRGSCRQVKAPLNPVKASSSAPTSVAPVRAAAAAPASAQFVAGCSAAPDSPSAG